MFNPKARLSDWYATLEDTSREDITSLAGILLVHKLFFGLAVASAVLFKLHDVASESGWSAQAVATQTSVVPKALIATAMAGFAALPWIILWRYAVYPRAKQYRAGDLVSHFVVVSLGLFIMLIAYDVVITSPAETASQVSSASERLADRTTVDALRPFAKAAIIFLSGSVFTVGWERYLDGRLQIDTPRRKTAAVVAVVALFLAPAAVGALPVADSGSSDADGTEAVNYANKSLYTDGVSGPDYRDRDSKPFSSTNQAAGVVVENPDQIRQPSKAYTGNYTPASVTYAASMVTVNHTRVVTANTSFIAPSHYSFGITFDRDTVILSQGEYETDFEEAAAWPSVHLDNTDDGRLVMEGVDSMWYYIDVVGTEGKVHRYVVKLDNPSVGSDTAPESGTTASANGSTEAAASIMWTIDGDESNTVAVNIDRLPPESQLQEYGLWEGCSVEHRFTETGTYTVGASETNVKLVRLGDYQKYGYHDFAPNSTDKCPPA